MGKINVLIDGESGTGKSAVCEELVRRGYHAINSDELAYNGDPETGKRLAEHNHETWIWDINEMLALLKSKTKVTFICGSARNRDKIINHFDYVFELMIDEATLRHRIATRVGNVWGKKPEELEVILRIHKHDENRPKNAIGIDATQPLHKVVDTILGTVASHSLTN